VEPTWAEHEQAATKTNRQQRMHGNWGNMGGKLEAADREHLVAIALIIYSHYIFIQQRVMRNSVS
jgi:hypothetical protein